MYLWCNIRPTGFQTSHYITEMCMYFLELGQHLFKYVSRVHYNELVIVNVIFEVFLFLKNKVIINGV